MSRPPNSSALFSGVLSGEAESNLPALGLRLNTPDIEDDLSTPSAQLISSRRMVPDQPDDPVVTTSTTVSTKKKPSVYENAPKNLPTTKPPSTAPTVKSLPVAKPPSTAPTVKSLPVTKPPSTAPSVKSLPVTKPPSTAPTVKSLPVTKPPSTAPAVTKPDPPEPAVIGPTVVAPPVSFPAPAPYPEQEPQPESIPIAGIPAVPSPENPVPYDGVTSGFSTESAGDSDPEPGFSSLSAKVNLPEPESLTTEYRDVFIGEQSNMEGRQGLLPSIGDFFRNLVGTTFSSNKPDAVPDAVAVPVVLPSIRTPPIVANPVESFRAGYISQRDLESALGREDWTMCCATTFLYAVQTKYPGLSRDSIIEAAGVAVKKELADGSGPCVSDDGYVASVYQYSQALSRELGLKEYVDTPGTYPSVEAARAAGVEMMKVELSGTANETRQEHHVFQTGFCEIDPAPEANVTDLWDKNSVHVENVMALEWYELP